MATLDAATSDQIEEASSTKAPNTIVSAYLSERVSSYRDLVLLKKKVWENENASQHFQTERQSADNPDDETKTHFYNMTCRIGRELNDFTGILLPSNYSNRKLAVLDLCMAPGGFTTVALGKNTRHVCGISLPTDMGGHEVRIPNWNTEPRITIKFLDITMLASEMGVDVNTEISATHPDAQRFSTERPFVGEQFHVIFCGGTVIRKHERAEYRQYCEKIRLETSQLVLALQRIRRGGTLVLVLHKADTWHSVDMMYRISGFAQIQLFKPRQGHIKKSSFYLVARNVQPQTIEAHRAVEEWKRRWREATLTTEPARYPDQLLYASDEHIGLVLSTFGERLVQLSRPIFKIQADGLRAILRKTQ